MSSSQMPERWETADQANVHLEMFLDKQAVGRDKEADALREFTFSGESTLDKQRFMSTKKQKVSKNYH